jgi:CRP-like cAMP-binding protein
MTDLWLFDQLAAEEKLAVSQVAKQLDFARGELLFLEGGPAQAVFLITSGRVKLFKTTEQGKEVILGLLGPDTLFGEEALLTERVHSFSAQAVEPTFVCACLKQDFERLVESNGQVSLKMLRAMAGKLAEMSEQAVALAAKDVRSRVSFALSRLAHEYGEPNGAGYLIPFRLTHEEIASLVGASRVMVTNVLLQLRQDGELLVGEDRRFVVRALRTREMVPEQQPTKPGAHDLCVCRQADRFGCAGSSSGHG